MVAPSEAAVRYRTDRRTGSGPARECGWPNNHPVAGSHVTTSGAGHVLTLRGPPRPAELKMAGAGSEEGPQWCLRRGPSIHQGAMCPKTWTRASRRTTPGTWPCWPASADFSSDTRSGLVARSGGTYRLRGPELRLLRHPDRLGGGPDGR